MPEHEATPVRRQCQIPIAFSGIPCGLLVATAHGHRHHSGKGRIIAAQTGTMMLPSFKELNRHRSCHSEQGKMREDLNSLMRRTRIISGVVLFAYASTHLLNHSVATVSIAAADAAREYFIAAWRNPVAEILLFASLALHILLGVQSVLRRKSFKMTAREWMQMVFPFMALLVLIPHVLTTATLSRVFGVEDNYELIFAGTLVDPSLATKYTVFYSLMIVMIWTHGVIGMNGLLAYRPFYVRFRRLFIGFFWAVPILALAGFISGVKEMTLITYAQSQISDEYYMLTILMKAIPEDAFPIVTQIDQMTQAYYPIVVLVLVALAVGNVLRARFFGQVTITYPNGRKVRVSRGTTILEASRIGKIPHQSVCGGKGRCTTCRVRIVSNDGELPVPNAHEIKAIERVGIDDDMRLACQLRPTGDLSVAPLLNPENSLEGITSARALTGKEQETVILFVDVREFTKIAEHKLPFDVVYILNKYYAVCGEIIEANGGRLDKFIGDGIMAIFDATSEIEENCRNAVLAASRISQRMKELNAEMRMDFDEEMRFGMGIHAGETIVGMMGYGRTVSETAVGDNVNVAARLEELSKSYKCQLVISKSVAETAKIDIRQFTGDLVNIRGRSEKLEILYMGNASELVV
jgi:adenylate cyclase